jgi:creatinine amidohydrolase
MMKYRLANMSWKEAEEAFKRSDTAILPVGTLHGHGPTPIGIDSSSADWLAEKVGKKTGLVTLPVVNFGENDKQKYYPGSITISPSTIENYFEDIFKSLLRNGIKKVMVINGHGGNRECLIRAGRAVRDVGMIIAILEWWRIGEKLIPDFIPPGGVGVTELSISLVVDGKDNADLRNTGYKGEWGEKLTVKNIFGDEIKPVRFNNFEYKGAPLIIPMASWDIDLEGPPVLGKEVVDELYDRGQEILKILVDYLIKFAKEFEKIDIADGLKSQG